MSGTSEVPQLATPLCATRKSAEAGQLQTSSDLRAEKVARKTCYLAQVRIWGISELAHRTRVLLGIVLTLS
jgi:hypothetical protein